MQKHKVLVKLLQKLAEGEGGRASLVFFWGVPKPLVSKTVQFIPPAVPKIAASATGVASATMPDRQGH